MNQAFLNKDCVLSAAYESFEGRWTTQVLFCIDFGEDRFSRLKRKLPGISDNILGQRLKQLAEHGLIVKKALRAEKVYALTPDGRALVRILEILAKWQTAR